MWWDWNFSKNAKIKKVSIVNDMLHCTVRRDVLARGLLISLAILKMSFLSRPFDLVATFKTFPSPMGWIFVCKTAIPWERRKINFIPWGWERS